MRHLLRRLIFFVPFAAALAVPTLPTARADAQGGAALAAERCARCHGADGRGVTQDYPSLAGQHADYIVKQIFNFKTGLRTSPLMQPVVNELKASDIRALSAHFSGLRPGRVVSTDAALAEAGRVLYHGGRPERALAACASCHGPAAGGGAQMPRLAGQNPVYLERQLRGFIQKARVNDRLMHIGLETLGEQDVKALAAYLGGIE